MLTGSGERESSPMPAMLWWIPGGLTLEDKINWHDFVKVNDAVVQNAAELNEVILVWAATINYYFQVKKADFV